MTRRDEILEVLCDYADDHVGNSPSERDLWLEMKSRGYKISHSTVRTHILKLMVEHRVERKDGKLIIVGADWIRPEENSNL